MFYFLAYEFKSRSVDLLRLCKVRQEEIFRGFFVCEQNTILGTLMVLVNEIKLY